MRRVLTAVLLLLLAAPAGAATIVLAFEEEAIGRRDDPFVSAACGCVELSGSHGLRIYLTDEGDTVLVAGADFEGGTLVLEFLVPVTAVSLDFGGDPDDPYIDPRPARLRGFSGGVEIALDEKLANRNGLVDQTLTIAPGVVMERAVFSFSQSGEYEPLSGIVDNVVLTTVPEPRTVALGALAALVATVPSVRRRRRLLPELW